MAQKKSAAAEANALREENARLKAELASAKKSTSSSANGKSRRKVGWKPFVVWFSIALATALLVVGNIFFWAGNTVVNTDRYVAVVGPLIQKPQVQTAIAQYTTTQIFNNVDVQSYVSSALPPKIDFLAPQLTTQLKSYTQKSVQTLLANPKVQSYWYSSLTRRHQALISFSKSYQGNGEITVSDIYSQLSTRLEQTNLSFLANKPLPAKVGSIQVTSVGWLPALHKLANNIGIYQAITTLLVIGFSALAVVLSSKRRRTVIQLGTFFALSMVATLVSLRIARGIAVSDIASTYQAAVKVAFDTVLHSFVTQTLMIMLVGILIALVAWISGPYRSATAIKSRINTLLAGKAHQAIFSKENKYTLWAGQHKRRLQWGSILVIAIIMLLVQLSPKLVVIYAILMVLCVLIVELLAASEIKGKQSGSKELAK